MATLHDRLFIWLHVFTPQFLLVQSLHLAFPLLLNDLDYIALVLRLEKRKINFDWTFFDERFLLAISFHTCVQAELREVSKSMLVVGVYRCGNALVVCIRVQNSRPGFLCITCGLTALYRGGCGCEFSLTSCRCTCGHADLHILLPCGAELPVLLLSYFLSEVLLLGGQIGEQQGHFLQVVVLQTGELNSEGL